MSEVRDPDEKEAAKKNRFDHTLALATLRCAMLINGGAAVAILAFMGSIWDTQIVETLLIYSLAYTTALFSVGLLSAGVAVMAMFFINCLYSSQRFKYFCKVLEIAFFCLIITSFLLFFIGIHNFIDVFKSGFDLQMKL